MDASECIWAKVVIAMHALEIGLVKGRITGDVLRALLLLLMLLAAAAEHLVEETELGACYGAEDRE